jgi:hypothetical protein
MNHGPSSKLPPLQHPSPMSNGQSSISPVPPVAQKRKKIILPPLPSKSLVKEENMIFNRKKFANAVKSIHLKPEEISTYEAIPDSEVRKRLDEFIDYEKNPRFSAALDEICENIVGRTMFKVLITKLTVQHKTMCITTHYEGNGSMYDESVVYVNLSFYEENGEGIPYHFYIDKKGEIKLKLKSLAGSIFHEFCHGLHDVSGTRKVKNIMCQNETDFGSLWTEDEELRTITCFNSDPICDHCFDLCQSILKNELFHPRYSYYSYKGEKEPSFHILRKHYSCIKASQKYMDGWKEYMLQNIE